ncbi:MAG: hypothetical protein IJT16_09175 [Lachnospiraceae bacterium]|nr:hypothetical protein [Lachnospiraceae bacterium]
MKTCPHCKLEVGGTFEQCPLCQSVLMGDATPDRFPKNEMLRNRSIPFRIITFLLVTGAFVCLSLDFLFIRREHVHFGLIVLIWSVAILWYVTSLVRTRTNLSRAISLAVLLFSAAAVLTEIVVGYRAITTTYIVPYLISAALVANFLLSFLDKREKQSGTFYVLWSIFIGIIPCIVVILRRDVTPLAWEICFFISVIAFICLVVFKGRTVFLELHKRFHF